MSIFMVILQVGTFHYNVLQR